MSSSLIDRVAEKLRRVLVEVPVGFKWFVDGLLDGSLGFGGEESAGASFLRRDGLVWTTDKDGIIMDLLAAEMMATTGRDPSHLYRARSRLNWVSRCMRVSTHQPPFSRKRRSRNFPPTKSRPRRSPAIRSWPGSPRARQRSRDWRTQGGHRAGLVCRPPSGTEDVYKLYAESFKGPDHLSLIQAEAQALIANVHAGLAGGVLIRMVGAAD